MEIAIVTTGEVKVKPYHRGYEDAVVVSIDDVKEGDLLPYVDITEAIKYYGIEELLDEIGESECITHFDLGPEEEG